MTATTRNSRESIYLSILASLQDRASFTRQEIQDSPAGAHPIVARNIIDELVRQGSLTKVCEQSGEAFRWKTDPGSLNPQRWVQKRLNNTTIPAAPPSDRPRERLLTHGSEHLKLAELFAILIRTGRPGESAMQAGEKLAANFSSNLEQITDVGHSELKDVSRAVSQPAYCQIMAGIELGRRVDAAKAQVFSDRIRITGPRSAMKYCLRQFERLARDRRQEEFHMVTLDTRNQPIASHCITVGTLRNSLVHPREVFRPAVRDAANCIMVVHNHPSGDPTPSDQDLQVTDRLESAAEIVGIPLVDHIIVAGTRALSLQEWRSGIRHGHVTN